ncbi:phage tail sheath family protein [Paenibacillus arenosi]|uniref:Phage tail sheath family protein n=1 Tax=Paenibacillus arenosi TaxID=2774142 RepID=A0ABR9B0W3_9BACL|nr:phage tail sheath family protein [Paenibacillus arenosi]MBD8499964.1 phage tail sheath family protein [Paenibacillus arenosi]
MPIGGGAFTLQNKVLPGAYINFVSAGGGVTAGARGVASLPLQLNWGTEDKLIQMDAADFNKQSLTVFGYDATAPELLLIRECFKRAKTLLVYRVNSGGAKATKTTGGLTATAKYSGTRGNDIRVAVLTNPAGGFDVVTYLGMQEVDKQTVTSVANLVANDFVTFGPTGTLAAAAAAPLTGGTNGTANGTTYSSYLTALEVENFNVLGYPGTDTSVKSLFVAFTKRLREDEGKKVVCVLHNQPADHEGIINVKNGVVLEDTTVVSGDKAVAWVAGATAAAEINQSLTNTTYDGAVDVDIKYTKSQYEAAIKAGEFVFYGEGSKARVLSDINSLLTFGGGKSPDWTSNRVMRVMDGWANDVARIFGASYIGLVTNNDTGRQLFKSDLVALALQYQGIGAISNFDSDDITIEQGIGKRDVAVHSVLQPNDSMEKLYMTVQVV